MTRAGVVIVSYATESVDTSWIPHDAPVVIVCNDDHRPATEAGNDIKFVDAGSNLGFGSAVNVGASLIECERLVIVNPDCELSPDHWESLAAGAVDEILTLRLTEPDGRDTTVTSAYPGPIRTLAAALRIRHRLELRGVQLKRPSHVDHIAQPSLAETWVSGAALSIDRARFLDIGGFDEMFFLYWEDVDLCRRLARRYPGMRVRLVGDRPGLHAHGASGQSKRQSVELERLLGAWRYASSMPGLRWSVVADLLARRVRRENATTERLAPARADIAVLSLARESASGERIRVQSWRAIAAASGLRVIEIRLDRSIPLVLLRLVRSLGLLRRHQIVPESLLWSRASLDAHLLDSGAAVVVCVTARAFDPGICEARHVVLDFVDRLSDSYRDRSTVESVGLPMRLTLKVLAILHRRFEDGVLPPVRRVAAGVADSERLGATYVPLVRTPEPVSSAALDTHDLVFVGTLDYLPNVDAVTELDAIWPLLSSRRPGTSMIVAGARPTRTVSEICEKNGWSLIPDFAQPGEIYASARVAVAPLRIASGMQIKVQDAMAHGTPVVCSPAAAAGYPSDAPIVVADRDLLVQAILDLLADDERRFILAEAARAWVQQRLDPAAYGSVLRADAESR